MAGVSPSRRPHFQPEKTRRRRWSPLTPTPPRAGRGEVGAQCTATSCQGSGPASGRAGPARSCAARSAPSAASL
eukprot:879515-Lingulodinium_polyedra.AAC.1